MNVDLPGPGGLAAPDCDLDNAVAILRLHFVGIDILRQRQRAAELATEALLPIVGGSLFRGFITAAGDREQVLLHLDVERFGIDAGRKYIDRDLIVRAADVDGRERAGRQGADAARPRRAAAE